MGLFFVACGMVFLILAVGGTLYPMSELSFGDFKVTGLSQFSALSAFIGIVLIAMGVTINFGRRQF